jgi:thioesterase domain-containing protein
MKDRSLLVPLRDGTGETSLFFLPDIGGNLFYTRPFLPHIAPDVKIFGFRLSPALFKTDDALTLESLATCCAEAILSSDYKGPYHLVGHSFAGLLAYETARQLNQMQGAVGIVALLDCGVPWRFRKIKLSQRPFWVLQVLVNNLKKIRNRIVSIFIENQEEDILRPKLGENDGSGKAVNNGQGYVKLNLKDHPVAQRNIIERLYQIMVYYVPQTYPGRVMVFKAKNHDLGKFGDMTRDMGWAAYATSGVDSVVISGDHLEIVREEKHVQKVAQELSNAIL